jgi:hypothetical protein
MVKCIEIFGATDALVGRCLLRVLAQLLEAR